MTKEHVNGLYVALALSQTGNAVFTLAKTSLHAHCGAKGEVTHV